MYNKIPKCNECGPQLMPDNQEIFDLFMMVRNQHIMSFGGPVDLNLNSIEFAMETLGIKNTKETFGKVYSLYHISLKIMREKAEAEKVT